MKPKLDYTRVVDGQRSIEFLKPIPTSSAGRRFEIQGTVVGVYDKGKAGTVVETKNELVDVESGEVYTICVPPYPRRAVRTRMTEVKS